jgi:hypothetical protein
MKRVILALLAVLSMSLIGAVGVAQAGEPDTTVPPAFVPPTPAPVTDNDTAAAFAKLYVARNARSLLRQGGAGNFDRRRIRVISEDAACLQSPILATRWGCVFTLRALVIQRRHHWRNWSHEAKLARVSGGRHDGHRVRIRNYGCLGFLRINGGPTVTPTAEVVNVECARVPRGDMVAPEPTDS